MGPDYEKSYGKPHWVGEHEVQSSSFYDRDGQREGYSGHPQRQQWAYQTVIPHTIHGSDLHEEHFVADSQGAPCL